MKKPSRRELAEFISNPATIRAFERLFDAAEEAGLPDFTAVFNVLRERVDAIELAPPDVPPVASNRTGAPVNGARVPGWPFAEWLVHTFLSVGTDETVAHTLGVAPTGLLQVRVPGGGLGDVIFGAIDPDASNVTLQSTFVGEQVVILYA